MRETQHLLHYGGAPALYPRDSWDSVVLYALEKQLSVMEANELLYELDEEPLLG